MKQCGSYQVVSGIFTETIMLRGCVILRHINRPQTAAVRECSYLLWKRLEIMAESTFNLIRERGGFDVYEEWIFFMLPPVETGHQLLAISSSHFPISPTFSKCKYKQVQNNASKMSVSVSQKFCLSFLQTTPFFLHEYTKFPLSSLLFIPFLYNSSICSDRKCLICN